MSGSQLQIRSTDGGIEVRLHVQPRARRSEISGIHNGALKVKILAPPVDDAANRAIIEFFASLLGVPKSAIQLVAGLKSRDKTLQIRGISVDDFRTRTGS